jgi:xylulokinase
VIDAMAALIGYKIGEIVCVGGGTRNHLWQQIKASVNERAVLVPAVGEGTLLGAALLAGIGAGIYKNEDEALAVVERSFTVYQPGSAEAEFYRKYCDQIYNRLYDTAHETNELLYNMPVDRCI